MITHESKNILVADDSVFFRTKLSAILIEAGHRVKFASDGKDVIREIQIDPAGIDLLVLDLQMPNVDGFGVLEWMRQNGYKDNFPVLAVTGVYERSEVLDRIKDLGAKGLMTKGFTPEQVIYWVNRLLFPEKKPDRMVERIPVSAPVDFTIGGESSHTGFLLNISPGGLFLHTRMELLPGTMITLKFSLPFSARVIQTKGMVKWTTPSNASKSLFGGAGVLFTSISKEDEDFLAGYVKEESEKLGIED